MDRAQCRQLTQDIDALLTTHAIDMAQFLHALSAWCQDAMDPVDGADPELTRVAAHLESAAIELGTILNRAESAESTKSTK